MIPQPAVFRSADIHLLSQCVIGISGRLLMNFLEVQAVSLSNNNNNKKPALKCEPVKEESHVKLNILLCEIFMQMSHKRYHSHAEGH